VDLDPDDGKDIDAGIGKEIGEELGGGAAALAARAWMRDHQESRSELRCC